MQLDQYLDLYLAETQEHLRTLNRGLLELEAAGGGAPLEEAFRAAHTIKGMSAMMGYAAVAALAHALEDGLDELRSGRRGVDGTLIDELLAAADALERSVETSVASPPPGPDPDAANAGRGRGRARGNPSPSRPPSPSLAASEQGGAAVPEAFLTVRVVLEEACLLKAARALIISRNAAGVATVLGREPAEVGDDFAGELRLFVAPGVERAALEAAIRAAGDVAAVEFVASAPDRSSDASSPPAAAPAPTTLRRVRVNQRHLAELAEGIGDLTILCGRLEEVAGGSADPVFGEVVERVVRRVRELEHSVLGIRLVPVGEVFDRLPRVVRDAARSLGKEVDFRLEGREIELDREILEELADPLVHLLRNAVDHGIESLAEREAAGKRRGGRLVLRAVRERSSVVIQVEDDGRGISRERVARRAEALGIQVSGEAESLSDEGLLRILSQAGFSTAERVSGLSGRGVGLDAVVNRVRELGGAVAMQSMAGKGTTFSLRIPITLALAQALRVRIGGEHYAIPLTHISEAVDLTTDPVEEVEGKEVLRLRGAELPLVRLRSVLQTPEPGVESAAVVTELGDRRAALAVDELVGREQIIVKGFDAAVGTLPIFSGATLLADGRPALVLDPISVFR